MNQNETRRGPLLTVIVPVYNEEATVGHLLERVASVPLEKQIIVVNDGSTDRTADVLRTWEAARDLELLAHSHNRGKGAAIKTALQQARGLYTIIQDADLEYDPADYPRLIAPLLSGDADIVYGSRYLRADGLGEQPWGLFRLGVCALNLAARILYGARLTDEATCYKVVPTQTLRAMDLSCERFEFCPEVTAKACRLRLRILEVPIRYYPRDISEGKKIRLRDGLSALRMLWRCRRWRQADCST